MEDFIKQLPKLNKNDLNTIIENYIVAGVEVPKPAANATNLERQNWITEVAKQLEAAPYIVTEETKEQFEDKEVGDLILLSFADYEAMQSEGDGAEVTTPKNAQEGQTAPETDENTDLDPEDDQGGKDDVDASTDDTEPTESIEDKLEARIKQADMRYQGQLILSYRNKIIGARRLFELEAGAQSFTVTREELTEML